MQDKLDWLSREGGMTSESFVPQAVQSMKKKLDWLSRMEGMTSAELEEEAAKQGMRGKAATFLKLLRTPAKKGPTQPRLDWLKRVEGMSREELEKEVKKRQAELDAIALALRRKSEDKPEEPGSA
jgi:hypothetical protein